MSAAEHRGPEGSQLRDRAGWAQTVSQGAELPSATPTQTTPWNPSSEDLCTSGTDELVQQLAFAGPAGRSLTVHDQDNERLELLNESA